MKICTLIICVLLTYSLHSQINSVIIHPNIILGKDTIESKKFITSLNTFLRLAQNNNEENTLVFEDEKIETYIQLDEIKGIEKSEKYKDDYFYKPYLTNIVAFKDNTSLVTISYIGAHDTIAYLRASFEFIAHKTPTSYAFSSPLLRNTKNWKVERIGKNTFHYQTSINKQKIKTFHTLTSTFDLKLKVQSATTDFYCCDNILELQKLSGVLYKSDYNGKTESIWSCITGEKKLILYGNKNAHFDVFDPHDLWHDRLSQVIPRSKVNKPVDEGCAYLYGGSWGLTWKEIFREFREQITRNKQVNWIAIKETPIYFKTKEFTNSADYIVNALLVKKIEKEKGFRGVWELLNVGPFESGNEKYYQTLEKLTGITKADYNNKVWELIHNEQ